VSEPNNSKYLQYLPAIFQAILPADGKYLRLGEFLIPFEENIAALEAVLATEDQFFSPAYTPAADFLPWLATWVALVLDEEWEEDKRRRLLSEAMELYRWRGTVRGMKRYLEIYTGLHPDDIEIRESRWPGGMQLDVASRIGFRTGGQQNNGDDRVATVPPRHDVFHKRPPMGDQRPQVVKRNALVDYVDDAHHEPMVTDYYLVDTVAPIGDTEVPDRSGTTAIAAGEPVQVIYPAGAVGRIEVGTDGVNIRYWERPSQLPRGSHDVGGTLLTDDVRRPHCFAVHLYGLADLAPKRRDAMVGKVRAILDAERPAHTLYYLKLEPTARARRRYMQIGVWSSVGLDTVISDGLARRSS
jgi:phage tail-like protein